MKHGIVILAVLLLTACSQSPFGLNPLGYTEQHQTLITAWEHTASYTYIPESKNYWKSPKEFEADGGGDCEDFVVDLLYHLGEGRLYIVRMNGSTTLHAVVEYRGGFLEAQVVGCYYTHADFTVLESYSWTHVMQAVTKGGTKSISY
jgi:hypothetical protein